MTNLIDVARILKGGEGSGSWGHDGSNSGGLSAIGLYLGSSVSERRTAANKLKKKKGKKKGGFNKRKHKFNIA